MEEIRPGIAVSGTSPKTKSSVPCSPSNHSENQLPAAPPNFVAAYLDNPPPQYPPLSRKRSETGKVLLRVLVSPAGRAERIEIDKTSGFPRLDAAATSAVERWRFVPAKQGSQPVAAWVIVPITFQLGG